MTAETFLLVILLDALILIMAVAAVVQYLLERQKRKIIDQLKMDGVLHRTGRVKKVRHRIPH